MAENGPNQGARKRGNWGGFHLFLGAFGFFKPEKRVVPPSGIIPHISLLYHVAAPASGEYTLRVDVAEANEVFSLYLDDALILQKTRADAGTSWDIVTPLNAAQMHLLKLEYAETSQNAGVRLQWLTTTTAPEVVPASRVYPAAILDDFVALATVYHRAAKFISGFALSESELNHLIHYPSDFGVLDFKALTMEHWQRVSAYTALRNAVPQAQGLLTDVFAAANRINPAPAMDDLKKRLYQATAWDEASLSFLVDRYFGLSVAHFRNEIALNWLREVMQIVVRTGLAPRTIAEWGNAETDFDVLHGTAQLLKNTVKAKYEEEDWLDLAGGLSDTIRNHQQQALIGYLLTRPAIQKWGARDADGLFEYFLIDVQMGACMDTSRVVQANAAIQMFVNRCLLNLESDMSSGAEKGVSPGAIDKDHWEWMKNYRVWEANRKVFLYPENWLEPEWRNDRSPFFKELESYLVQNDITDRNVEQAFRNYLASLSQVANLEVCGMCRENDEKDKLKALHVFARTHNSPYKFFYRRWNKHQKWSAWEKVEADIRCVESGEKSGVHLGPIVWKNRLFLFWPEFMAKVETPSNSGQTVAEVFNAPMSDLEPDKYWEIRLAWSEYVEGKWTPKQISKEFVKQGYWSPGEAALRFTTNINEKKELTISLATELPWFGLPEIKFMLIHTFELSDITSKVNAHTNQSASQYKPWYPTYSVHFMNLSGSSPLNLLDNSYLKTATSHKLLLTADSQNISPKFEEPFFFSAIQRTYFVRPVETVKIEQVKNPALYRPDFDRVDDSFIPIDIPDIGPDDLLPQDPLLSEFAGGSGQPVMPISAPLGDIQTPAAHLLTASAAGAPMLKSYGMETSSIEPAFGRVAAGGFGQMGNVYKLTYDTGLEFHTFYHPFSSKFVTRLNQGGMPALMGSDTENPLEEDAIESDHGVTFEKAYDPNFRHGWVQKPADFANRTYYKEDISFDVYGANSLYNWELFFHAPLYIATRLSKNGQFEAAMKWFHYIFDPTTDEMPKSLESETSRYWKVLPFKIEPKKSLEDLFQELNSETDPSSSK